MARQRGVRFTHKGGNGSGSEGRRSSFSDISEDGSPSRGKPQLTLETVTEVRHDAPRDPDPDAVEHRKARHGATRRQLPATASPRICLRCRCQPLQPLPTIIFTSLDHR